MENLRASRLAPSPHRDVDLRSVDPGHAQAQSGRARGGAFGHPEVHPVDVAHAGPTQGVDYLGGFAVDPAAIGADVTLWDSIVALRGGASVPR